VLKSPRAIQVNMLIHPPEPPRRQIGFNVHERRATYRAHGKDTASQLTH